VKRITPSFVPWGTLPFRVFHSDRVPPILTTCCRSVNPAKECRINPQFSQLGHKDDAIDEIKAFRHYQKMENKKKI